MATLSQDVRYGYRNLLRNPGFTTAAVLSLALGIGANTAIFSFIDTVLLKNLPVSHPERLVLFGDGRSRGVSGGPPDSPMELFSWREYQNFRSGNNVFEDVLAINSRSRSDLYLTSIGENSTGVPEHVQAHLVSGNFFDVLGVHPAAGRFFDSTADRNPGASPYCVISDGFWERHFHRGASAIGQAVQIAGTVYTILGVAPRGFFGVRLGEAPDVWLPLSMMPRMPWEFSSDLLQDPLLHFTNLIGRLRPGVTLEQAQANVSVLYRNLLPDELGAQPTATDLESIRRASVHLTQGSMGISALRQTYRLPLRILMTVVGLVLLIACANVANLQLALAARRQKEFALRFAMGASRTRVTRQLLTESLLLAGAGGFVGVLLANGAGKLLVHLISTGPAALPLDFEFDRRVLAFTVLLCAFAGLLFGIVPALRASRGDLNSSLKETRASMAAPAKMTFGRILVAGQVALSLGLLITAGLLLHSFANLVSLGAGYDSEGVLLFKIDTDASGYQPGDRLIDLYRRLDERIARIPGIASEGFTMFSFAEGQRLGDVTAAGFSEPEIASMNAVSPGYFAVLRIPVIQGRGLQPSDTNAGPHVTVISESLARSFFGDSARAVGHTVTFGDDKAPILIVGVARDVKPQTVRDKDVKTVWLSLYQMPVFARDLAVRFTGDPSRVTAAVRRAIAVTEPNLPIRWTTTLADALSDSLVKERAIAELSTFFAGLALLLSAIGLYGTISFGVARRTGEIGIRMALGAERAGVLGMVLREALTLAAAGIAAGLPLALLAARSMESMLYGLAGFDLFSIVVSIGALTLVILAAAYFPARRAASVDPIAALRYE